MFTIVEYEGKITSIPTHYYRLFLAMSRKDREHIAALDKERAEAVQQKSLDDLTMSCQADRIAALEADLLIGEGYTRNENAGNGDVRCKWCGQYLVHEKGCPGNTLTPVHEAVRFLVQRQDILKKQITHINAQAEDFEVRWSDERAVREMREAERDQAIKEIGEQARKLGYAEARAAQAEAELSVFKSQSEYAATFNNPLDVAADRDAWKARAVYAEAENARLREASEFYASPENAIINDVADGHSASAIQMDNGRVARAALAQGKTTTDPMHDALVGVKYNALAQGKDASVFSTEDLLGQEQRMSAVGKVSRGKGEE